MNHCPKNTEIMEGDMFTIKLDKKEGHKDHRTITFSTDRYHYIDHGYAATVHKSHSDVYYDQKLREAAKKYDQLEKGVTFNAR
jgi:hypothetical protein